MVSKLLNAEHAHALLEKLCDYPLNSEHPRGKNKAIVFRSALGFTINGAERLRSIVLDAVLTFDAVETTPNEYGKRFYSDDRVARRSHRAPGMDHQKHGRFS